VTAEPPREQAEGKGELRRAISPRLLLFFVIGDILGTGIYALTGEVAGEVGGALWAPFLAAFIVALFTATSYLELVGKYPKAAGAALYTNRAFQRPFVTFLVAFAVMASGVTSAGAAARAFGGDYLSEFVTLPTAAVAIGFLVVVALVNFRGVGESVKANFVLTLVELSGLIFIIGIGVWAVLQGNGEPGRLLEFDTEKGTWLALTSATSLAFFALVGFEDSVNMAEEVHDPPRVFPRALLLGLAITGCIYVAVAITSSLLVPPDVLQGSDGPLLEVVKAGAPAVPLALFSFVALFAVANSALINMLMASRLVYGMAQERIVPDVLGRVHQRRRTPWVAILFTTVLAVLLAGSADLEDLGGTTALLLLCVFTVVNAAVLVLRRDRVEHRHFRAPTVLPVLGIISCAYLASPLAGRDAEEYLIGGALLVIGVVLWAVNRLVLARLGESSPDSSAAQR
jgi:APA family basic amino acid/polyamine antiporter